MTKRHRRVSGYDSYRPEATDFQARRKRRNTQINVLEERTPSDTLGGITKIDEVPETSSHGAPPTRAKALINSNDVQTASWESRVPTAPRAMQPFRSNSEVDFPYRQPSKESESNTLIQSGKRTTVQDIPLHFESLKYVFPAAEYSEIRHDPSFDSKSSSNIVFNQRFRKAENEIKTIWRELVGLSQGMFEDIHERLTKLNGPYSNDKPIVGLTGDSGQGKSRLIGVLLDDPNIVISADSGRSATRVPIEYRMLHVAEPEIKYESEVIIMPWEQFEYRLKRTLLDVVRGLFHAESIEDTTEVIHASCQMAKEFLSSLFKNDPRFQDEKNLKTLLKDAKGLEDHAGRAHIFELARAQYEAVKNNPETFRLKQRHSTTSFHNGMWEKIFPYAFGAANSILPFEPWPMVKRIIIRSRADILEHLLLRDLPGLDDHSYLNVEAAQKDLIDCDLEVVVHNIGRVISGTSAMMHMRESRERGGRSRKIILVPTMKDHIGTGHGLHLHVEFSAAEKAEWESNESYKAEIERDKHHMDSRLYDYAQEWLKFRNLTLIVRERDRRVNQAWEECEVFPTSAHHYEINVAGYPAKGPIPLMPQDTGIPQLKKYLTAFPSRNRYKRLYNYAGSTLGALITSVSSRLQQKNPENQVVSLDFFSSQEIVQQLEAEISRSFDSMISDPLLDVARESIQSWINKAISEHRKWQPDSGLDNHWYANQHRAWMVHHGDHSTRRQKHIVWNRHLLRAVVHTLLPEFDATEDNCSEFLAPAEEMLFKTLDKIRTQLRSQSSQCDSDELETVLKAIDSKKLKISTIIRQAAKDVHTTILVERQRTTKDDYGYYFREAMHPVYEKALTAIQPGEALYKTRARSFDTSLMDAKNGPFASIVKGLAAALEKQRKRTIRDICNQVEEEFETLKADQDQRRSSRVQSNVNTKERRIDERLEKLERSRGQIIRILDQLKLQYNVE